MWMISSDKNSEKTLQRYEKIEKGKRKFLQEIQSVDTQFTYITFCKTQRRYYIYLNIKIIEEGVEKVV